MFGPFCKVDVLSVDARYAIPISAASCAVLILVLRAYEAFGNPQIWAEDGSLFWIQQNTDGLAALFKPYAGYQNLLPRLTAAVVIQFDRNLLPCCLPMPR